MEISITERAIEYFEHTAIQPVSKEDIEVKEDFKPKGAIAFFILLIALCMGVWYGIYFLMLQRN